MGWKMVDNPMEIGVFKRGSQEVSRRKGARSHCFGHLIQPSTFLEGVLCVSSGDVSSCLDGSF